MTKGAQRAGTKLQQAAQVESSRALLAMSLSMMQSGCTADPSGAANATQFDPQVASKYQAESCKVTAQTAQAFGSPSAEGDVIQGTDDESKATDLHLDPSTCVRFTAGSAKIIACDEATGFKVIDMENVDAAH